MSIRKRFYLLFILTIVVPLVLIGWISYEFSTNIYRDQISSHMLDTLDAIDLNVNATLSEVESFTEYIATSPSVYNYLTTEEWPSTLDRINNESTISRLVFNNQNTFDFFILSKNNDPLYFLAAPEERFQDLEGSVFFEEVTKRRGGPYWIGPASDDLIEENSTFFTVGRSIIDPRTLEELGHFVLLVKPEILNQTTTLGSNSDSEWLIINEEGRVIHQSAPDKLTGPVDTRSLIDTEGIYTDSDGREFLYAQESTFQDWTLVSMKSMESVNNILIPVRLFTIGIIVALFLLLVLFHRMFSERLILFINTFNKGMTEAAGGDLNVRMEDYKEQEFTTLTTSFNDMVSQLRDMIKKVEEEQNKKQAAEFKVLQHQINPHFLYNTLESVNALASLQKTKEVQHLVTNLGKLLRISLKGPYEIQLQEEIKHVCSYLEIQKIRHMNRFDYDVEVDQGVQNNSVLKLILQPIVENSIEHGKKHKTFNHISIQAKRKENRIVIHVTDNGPGFTEDILLQLNNRHESSFTGLGLLNVHDRIRMYYSGNSGLVICSTKGQTTIQITIPIKGEG
ncbi:sensor histidine kinase [Bacillus sp. H-16]|uniref:histidine kinase n=1 Tax=Alteribacter salitolerans TaxID=2912333 RepID=UPI00196394C5|nr:sensor histidine kinase [Alteribacter salitolerans]